MFMTEFDEQDAIRVWREDGRTDMALESAINLLKKGIPAETISECNSIPLEKVLELQKEIAVNA